MVFFDTFCVLSPQNFETNLIMPLTQTLVEVEVTQEPRGRPTLTLGFLGHFWPNFQNFWVLGTQNFEPNLIMTFADGLAEVEVIRGGEGLPN